MIERLAGSIALESQLTPIPIWGLTAGRESLFTRAAVLPRAQLLKRVAAVIVHLSRPKSSSPTERLSLPTS
jgi:hypothetical protein